VKYLITAQRNTVESPSMEAWVALLEATKEYFKAHLEDGTFDCVYIFLEARGGFAVMNADSHEQAQDIVVVHPQYPFYDWEFKPILDGLLTYDRFIDLYRQRLG
jgi:hypothetical protein